MLRLLLTTVSWGSVTESVPIGPVRSDPSWQAHHHPKFASNQFQIDWDKQVAICPKGHQSQTWSEKIDESGQPIIDRVLHNFGETESGDRYLRQLRHHFLPKKLNRT